MSRYIRLLLVEDNPMDARFVTDALADAESRFAVEHVRNLEQAKAALAEGHVDIVLLDLNLPDSLSLDTCWVVLALAADIPIVVYTSETDEAAAIEAVHRGAQDYVIKGEASQSQLLRAIHLAIARHSREHRASDWRAASIGTSELCPQWNHVTRELTLGGVLVKSYRQNSCNQFAILSAFEEERWPKRIDDPLRQNGDVDPKQRLRATIKSLNKYQRHELVRFCADGTGQGVEWRLIELGEESLTEQG